MIKKLASLLLLFSFTAQAGLPPTTIKGQSDASPVTTFNLQVPGSGITRLGGPNALIETGYKNYIQDPGAENPNGPTVWATYSNTAQATPVTGTGGTATVTWTRTTTSPLRGTGSFLFTKTAVNSQGQGASYDFTIDSADQAKVLNVSFDYAVASGTYADSDLTVYLYDKTNSQIIQPAGYQILSAATGLPVKQVSTTFQTASNSTSYRLIFHCASTSALSYSLKFDSISVSPSIITQGTPVTDWQSLTPTLTGFGTASSVNIHYRRVGDTLEEEGSFVSGTPTASNAQIGIPSGLTIDTSISAASPVGKASRDNTSNAANDFNLIANPGGSGVFMTLMNISGTNALSALPANNLVIAGDTVGFFFRVKVQGWSSQVQMSSDASTAPMEAKVYLSGNVTSTSLYVVPFDRIAYDTAGAFNTTSHGYVVPKPGYWEVKLTSNLAGGNTGSYEVYKNGSPISDGPTNNILFYQGTANNVMSGSIKVKCAANDVLTVVSTANGANIIAGGTFATFSQSLGPSQIAASETVAVTGYKTGDVAAGTGLVDLIFDTTDDSHGAYNTSTGVWSCPSPGRYNFYAGALLTGTATTAGKQLLITDQANTVIRSIAYNNFASGNPYLNGSAQLKCAAGQQYKFRVDRNTDSLAINGSSGTWTNFHIERIGN